MREEAASYPEGPAKRIHEGGCTEPHIFSAEGTVSYWKKVPSGQSVPGFKASKDRLLSCEGRMQLVTFS